MIEKSEIIRLIEEKLENTANYLVDVIIKSDNIIVEIDNDKGVCINDCENLSRYLEERLDLSAKNFELEVGSAGITSPFKVLRQYQKNIGNVFLNCYFPFATFGFYFFFNSEQNSFFCGFF